LAKRLCELNIATHFAIDGNSWPPVQPEKYTPLLFIHHQSQYSIKQAVSLQFARVAKSGDIDVKDCSLDDSKMTKQIVDILYPLQESNVVQFVLIEGLPGSESHYYYKKLLTDGQ